MQDDNLNNLTLDELALLNQLQLPMADIDPILLQQCFGQDFDSTTQTIPEQADTHLDFTDEPKNVESLVDILGMVHVEDRQPIKQPPSFNLPGNYDFDIDFDLNADNNVVYSQARDKLYVAKDVPCVFNFRVSHQVPCDSIIRVTSVFLKPEHFIHNVARCLNHAQEDFQKGIPACDHIIRSDVSNSCYVKNRTTLRRSLIVPFNNPIMGSHHSPSIFRFACHSSCIGGLNRRPIKVIFTLENNGYVIGRRSMELKICSSPWRDCSNDDKRMNRGVVSAPTDNTNRRNTTQHSKKRKREDNTDHFVDVFQFINDFVHSSGKKKESNYIHNNAGPFIITARDAEELRVLQQAKLLYEFFQFVKSIQPEDIVNWICKGKKNKKS